jgi:putative addiction module component (TIGR02574 family)
MTREAEKLFAVAATLPPAERAELVVRLLDSIAAPDDEVTAAQRSESRARLDAVRDGAIDLVDDDDAMRMIAG